MNNRKCTFINLVPENKRGNAPFKTKALKYEVLIYVQQYPGESQEIPQLIAKFRNYGDAFAYAYKLTETPDPTAALLRY